MVKSSALALPFLLVLAACASSPSPAEAPREDPLDAALRARSEGRLEDARREVAGVVERTAADPGSGASPVLETAARLAASLGDPRTAARAWEIVLAAREAAMPPDPIAAETARVELAAVLGEVPDHARALDLAREAQRRLAGVAAPEDALLLRASEVEGGMMWRLGDIAGGGAKLAAIRDVRERTCAPDAPELQKSRIDVGITAYMTGDAETARQLLEQAHEVLARTIGPDDGMLQGAREILAAIRGTLGDVAGRRELFELVLASRERMLSDEHPDLQRARGNLAVALREEGEHGRARELLEKANEVGSRTLPADDVNLQKTRLSLAQCRQHDGDTAGALELQEAAVAALERALPSDHSDLQTARQMLAGTLSVLGENERALALAERACEGLEAIFPPGDPRVLSARSILGAILHSVGRLEESRAVFADNLREVLLAFPEDHPEVQEARAGLAAVLGDLGRLEESRVLDERVLEVRENTLAPDDLQLALTRQNLGSTLREAGDLDRARALLEAAFESLSRVLPEDHPDLQAARTNLGGLLCDLGQVERAKRLQEQALAALETTWADDDLRLQVVRQNLAGILNRLGETERACAFYDKILEVRSRKLAEGNIELAQALGNAAACLAKAGDDEGARRLDEAAIASVRSKIPATHPFLVSSLRNLAWTLHRTGDEAALEACLLELARGLREGLEHAMLSLSPRESESIAVTAGDGMSTLLSLLPSPAPGRPASTLEREAFALVESARSIGIVSHRVARRIERAAEDPAWRALRDRVRAASAELTRFARTAEGGAELLDAVERKEKAERALREALEAAGGGRSSLPAVDAGGVGARLREGEVAIGFWKYMREDEDHALEGPESREPSFLAFVVRSGGALERVELGPAGPIEAAVESWRAALAGDGGRDDLRGVGVPSASAAASWIETGERVRGRILDPLGASVLGATRIVVAPDDVLHVVPLDALPGPAGAADLVGDRTDVVVRPALHDLSGEEDRPPGDASLLVLGGLDYRAAAEATFEPLPETAAEVDAVAATFASRHGTGATIRRLEGSDARKQAFLELAPGARFLHLATHGYFSRDSGASRPGAREGVAGFSPMLLCGLALSGADAGPDETGEIPGRITAEEIAGLDLRACELAVLSACDTSVGLRRAGQGVASLQTALHAAGARRAVTSLWKVSDEGARQLMSGFYRRLWVDGMPPRKALWEAKRELRAAGAPARDWSGWILTGDAD